MTTILVFGIALSISFGTGYHISADDKVRIIRSISDQPDDKEATTEIPESTIPPPPSINYGSMIGMVVGVAVLFTCSTYGKYAFRAFKSKLEDNAGHPFPPVVYSQAYQASLQATSPKPTFSQSLSADLTVSSDTTDTTLPVLSPIKPTNSLTEPTPAPTKPTPAPTKPTPAPTNATLASSTPTNATSATTPDQKATNSGPKPTESGPKQIGSIRTPPMQSTHGPTTDPLEGMFSESETLVKCTTV
ncbi:hypothetical protein ACHWQZ_G014937 [Mnemiopsis leidyi]